MIYYIYKINKSFILNLLSQRMTITTLMLMIKYQRDDLENLKLVCNDIYKQCKSAEVEVFSENHHYMYSYYDLDNQIVINMILRLRSAITRCDKNRIDVDKTTKLDKLIKRYIREFFDTFIRDERLRIAIMIYEAFMSDKNF